ncbi:MAG: hypothetical protein ACXWM7_04320, partial [Parachlamydiaceae bacterium]
SVLNTLIQFDHQKHYLQVNGDQLIIQNKSDLGWMARFTRFFWKPENERIEAVAKAIFNLPSSDLFQELKDEKQLTHVFSQLNHLSEKADLKLKNTSYRQMVFHMQNASFASLGAHKQSQEIEKKKIEVEQELEEKRVVAESKNGSLAEQIKQQKATLDLFTFEFKKHLKLLKKAIAKLEQQRNYLTSDTVIWTDDGYSLASSSIFAADSMPNSPNFDKLAGRSEQIEQRLAKLAEEEKEKSEQLKTLPKHIYLENTQRQDVQLLLELLEKGPSFAPEYIKGQYEQICAIADYLQEPHPANVRGQINGLLETLEKKETLIKKSAEENASLQKELERVREIVFLFNKNAQGLRQCIDNGWIKDLKPILQELLFSMSHPKY